MDIQDSVGFQSLPQEVVDNIIDELAADSRPNNTTDRRTQYDPPAATLIACTLVCRAWLPRSSKYVLESIKVHRPLAALDQLLVHAQSSPRLHLNVRTLYVPHRIDEQSLAHALEVFTKLASIYFLSDDSQLYIMICDEDLAQPVPSSMRGRYSIGCLEFDRFFIRCVQRYLALFRYIDHLRLDIIWVKSYGLLSGVLDLVIQDRTQHLHLTTLTIGTMDANVLRFLQPMLAPGTLKSLVLESLVTRGCRFVEPFLKEACSCLMNLHVKVCMVMWDSPQINHDLEAVLPLSSCGQLSTVELIIERDTTCSIAEFHRFFRFACSFILGDLSPSVRRIQVVFDPDLPDFRDPALYTLLRNIAEAVKVCEALDTIEFVGRMGGEHEDGWTFAACRDFLKSKVFSRSSYVVNVVETPSL